MMEEKQMQTEEKRTTGGFLFYNQKDAALAETEQKKIAYLEARMDYSDPERILQIYEKAVKERIFTTPIGIIYLKEIQDFLMKQPRIDKAAVSPIPLFHTYDAELRKKQEPARKRIKPSAKKQKWKAAFPISIILNLILAAAVVAMFVITLQSDNPNVLNYEKALINQYASWEQELTEREQAVREKERELKIETEDGISQF